MRSCNYLVIGGGMTADAAVKGIRELDASGSICLLGEEAEAPYDRPPLTKGLWKGTALDKIWRGTENEAVQLRLGRRVQAIDVARKQATDQRGEVYAYQKLLLATGGRPRRLPFGSDLPIYYRTVADYRRLRELASQHQRFVVLGAGFIGSEIAASLAMNGREVILLFPGQGIGGRIFPPDLSRELNRYYREKGVDVRPQQTVTRLESRHGTTVVGTASGEEFPAAGVVAGLGIEPNVELAQAAGLAVDNGIVVNERLQCSSPDIYAAGDVAAFVNPALAKRIRVEHEDNANTMGRIAGHNLAGLSEPYHHLPFFYSDLFDLGYEAVGDLDARLETFADWQTPFREGVVYYLQQGRVRGVLLWNVWGKVDEARRLIREPGPFSPAQLKGRISA